MKSILSENLKILADKCPYPLYVVGGYVRDFLAGLKSDKTDIDLAAPAPAADFLKRAEECGFTASASYGNTGTVKLEKEGEAYEFACFRSDRYVRGEHVPAEVFFTDDISLDARRRDFKCNAVYYDIKAGKFCDPLGGIAEIKSRTMSTVAPPEKVFGEDGLRLMRLARIAAQTGFAPTEECLTAARHKRLLCRDVSAERIWGELKLILEADCRYGRRYAQYRGLKILQYIGVLGVILPEVTAGRNVAQRSDYHNYDVFEHSLRAVKYSDVRVRMAALLHDVGKPVCFKAKGNFHGHEEESAKLAEKVCERLKVPKREAKTVVRLVETHMYDFDCAARECRLRRFIVANSDIIGDIMLVKQADFSACKDDMNEAPSVARIKYVMQKMEDEGAPLNLKQLNVRGDRLLAEGFAPQQVGAALSGLLNDCCIGAVANDEEKLVNHAKKVYLRRAPK